MIPHEASYSTKAFDVVKHLEDTLEAKRNVLSGQISEHGRIERQIVGTRAQIADLEAALTKLKAAE